MITTRIARKVKRSILQLINIDSVTLMKFTPRKDQLFLGKGYYGQRVVLDTLLDKDSICYCAGCGEDISFDLGLIDRYGCDVFAFDPTPRSIDYVKRNIADIDKYHFFEYGIGGRDEVLRFYCPLKEENVSYSIDNPYNTEEYFDASVKSLSTIMRENNHNRVDLLKLNIEGAEYGVIDSVLNDNIEVSIMSVDFHGEKAKIISYINKIIDLGYDFIFAQSGTNYTFAKKK